MVSTEETKRFLSRINDFVKIISDITEKISKLEEDRVSKTAWKTGNCRWTP
jgi:hypothetical protein